MAYRIMIVDDEPLARARLKRLLVEYEQFTCSAEVGSGDEALSLLSHQTFDLVLLDIDMPGRNGIETAEAIAKLPKPPKVVFCTAYEQHALDAFSVKAVDYLLKPIRKPDLTRALSSVADWLEHTNEELAPTPKHRTHINARTHQGMQLIPVDEIIYFSADQKYVNVHHIGGETLIDDSLKKLEDEFGEHFLRIHRAVLVSKDRIDSLKKHPEDGQQIFLKGLDEGLGVSRRHLPMVRKVLKAL